MSKSIRYKKNNTTINVVNYVIINNLYNILIKVGVKQRLYSPTLFGTYVEKLTES